MSDDDEEIWGKSWFLTIRVGNAEFLCCDTLASRFNSPVREIQETATRVAAEPMFPAFTDKPDVTTYTVFSDMM
jgi:hypothetical protein